MPKDLEDRLKQALREPKKPKEKISNYDPVRDTQQQVLDSLTDVLKPRETE